MARVDDPRPARLSADGSMSPRQERIMAFVRRYIIANGRAPSFRNIGAAEQINAQTVAYHLAELEAAGLIARTPHTPRSIRLVA